MHYNNFVLMDSHPWTGKFDASILWCEPKGLVTPYIAEFWNTLTSLSFCVLAIYGIVWKLRNGIEARFIVLDLAIFVIGAGSAAFHALLTFWSQLLDEIPMLVGAFHWCFICLHLKRDRIRWEEVVGLIVMLTLWVLNAQVLHFSYNVWFEVFFGVILALCYASLIHRTYHSAVSRAVTYLLIVYVVLAAVAFLLWNIDQIYCTSLRTHVYSRSPFIYFSSLHGWWHVLMCGAAHFGAMAAIMLRLEHLRGSKGLRLSSGILPLAYYDAAGKKN